MKKSFIALLILDIFSALVEIFLMFIMVFTNNSYYSFGIIASALICFSIYIYFNYKKKQIESKFFNNINYEQIKLASLKTYLKSKNLSREDLEKIINILIREEVKENKKVLNNNTRIYSNFTSLECISQ